MKGMRSGRRVKETLTVFDPTIHLERKRFLTAEEDVEGATAAS